ncbi:MAG: hypothetical protein JXC36_01290 [Candidatus Atribacteria bacterium]|nr:hypothetical protein [Candidatus Atribacteria bacterium]
MKISTPREPTFFSFYSPDLEGFTSASHFIEDCAIRQSLFATLTATLGKISLEVTEAFSSKVSIVLLKWN